MSQRKNTKQKEEVDDQEPDDNYRVKNISSSRNQSFGRRLRSISNYDLFWLAFGVFILRWLYFLSTNGMPHKPTPKPAQRRL